MKKKDDFCRESNHFLKSVCLALCLISSGGSAVYAATLQTEQTTLTVRMNNCTIKDVFDHIEKNSEFVFVYHGANIDLHRRVNLDVRDKSVEVILERLFKGTDVEYIINNRQIIVRRNEKKENSSLSIQQAKKITVTGIVKDTHGEPLIGVNVLVKGSRTGTITDMDGHFYLDVPGKNSVIEISYIGFKTQQIKVGSKINFDVILEEDIEALDEVVVTGYGSQKKMSVIGSIETLQPKKLQVGATRSLSNNLAGQIAGVIAVQRSGEPGYDSSNFWIRGIASFSGGQSPLVLVDGIERDLNNIDPAEIESFSVLKDASASAMYGVRGANGVVLVTTRSGQEGRTKVTWKSSMTLSYSPRMPEYLEAYDYASLANEARVVSNMDPLYSPTELEIIKAGLDNDLYPNVNWQKEILKDVTINHQHYLNVSGGGKVARYFVSVGGTFKDAIFKQDKVNK